MNPRQQKVHAGLAGFQQGFFQDPKRCCLQPVRQKSNFKVTILKINKQCLRLSTDLARRSDQLSSVAPNQKAKIHFEIQCRTHFQSSCCFEACSMMFVIFQFPSVTTTLDSHRFQRRTHQSIFVKWKRLYPTDP